MNTFTKFQELPTELRLQVWEYVIGDEAPKRKVRVDDFAFSIIPDPSLISPLLSACPESRQVALSYYCDPIPIHAFKLSAEGPKPPKIEFETFEESMARLRSDRVFLSFGIGFDGVKPNTTSRYNPCHAERQGRRTGTLHVSLAADTFVDGGRALSWKVLNPYDCNDCPYGPVPFKCPRSITPVLGASQYNQVIRTMNDNRIPLEGLFRSEYQVRRRLAPRHPA
ncbi:hypothetical protein PG984_009560 [Apiospora sp. TS-2023a]